MLSILRDLSCPVFPPLHNVAQKPVHCLPSLHSKQSEISHSTRSPRCSPTADLYKSSLYRHHPSIIASHSTRSNQFYVFTEDHIDLARQFIWLQPIQIHPIYTPLISFPLPLQPRSRIEGVTDTRAPRHRSPISRYHFSATCLVGFDFSVFISGLRLPEYPLPVSFFRSSFVSLGVCSIAEGCWTVPLLPTWISFDLRSLCHRPKH